MRFRINKPWYVCPLLSETGTGTRKSLTMPGGPKYLYNCTVNKHEGYLYDVTLSFVNDTELDKCRIEMLEEVVEIINE